METAARAVQRFRRVVIIGGGCYGSWYTQQLARAAARGALECDEVIVVDRNEMPPARVRYEQGEFSSLPLRFVASEWNAFLADWLAGGEEALRNDAMVPSPLMPHLLLDWLIARASSRWPARDIRVVPLDRAPQLPWQRAAPDGRHYVSFADWMCPVNCIEPARCPATRGERSWSMPVAIGHYVEANNDESSRPLHGPVIFHCLHRTYGVGMIDIAPVVVADERIASWASSGPARILIGTLSHCHGALGILSVS